MIKIIENQADVDRHISNPIERTYAGDARPPVRAYNCGNQIRVMMDDREINSWMPYYALQDLAAIYPQLIGSVKEEYPTVVFAQELLKLTERLARQLESETAHNRKIIDDAIATAIETGKPVVYHDRYLDTQASVGRVYLLAYPDGSLDTVTEGNPTGATHDRWRSSGESAELEAIAAYRAKV